jgi:Tol biopolymer transport system component
VGWYWAIAATAAVLAFTATGSSALGTSTRLAYIGKDAIYLVNTDGSSRELIVRGVEDHTTFSWSPDGRRLSFSGGHERADEIFVVNLDGSGVTRLTQPPGTRKRTQYDWSEDPNWSPDGTRIVFDGARDETDGYGHIYVINADGTGKRQLTRGRVDQWMPAWSPDGRKILYEQFVGSQFAGSTKPARIDLYTINPDGSGRRKLTRVRNESNHCACAVWSPDGSKIAYEGWGTNGKPDIYVMNADGTNRVQLTHHRARDENPDWSPDGTSIAFYSERPGNAEVYIMRADGSQQTRVTHDPWYDQAVRWEPAQSVVSVDGSLRAFPRPVGRGKARLKTR